MDPFNPVAWLQALLPDMHSQCCETLLDPTVENEIGYVCRHEYIIR